MCQCHCIIEMRSIFDSLANGITGNSAIRVRTDFIVAGRGQIATNPIGQTQQGEDKPSPLLWMPGNTTRVMPWFIVGAMACPRPGQLDADRLLAKRQKQGLY